MFVLGGGGGGGKLDPSLFVASIAVLAAFDLPAFDMLVIEALAYDELE